MALTRRYQARRAPLFKPLINKENDLLEEMSHDDLIQTEYHLPGGLGSSRLPPGSPNRPMLCLDTRLAGSTLGAYTAAALP